MAIATGCSPAETKASVKKIPANQEFSGFLKDYASLKPNPNLDGNALTFAAADAKQNLRSYFAIIVDPVEVYVATDADASKVDDEARIALTNYFQHALVDAVSDILTVSRDDIHAVPQGNSIDTELLSGIVTHENRMVGLIDLEAVISTSKAAA